VLRAAAGLDQVAQAGGRCNREGTRSAADSEVLVFEAPEYGVIRELRINAETGRSVLAAHAEDPFGEAAMRAYFEELYERKGRKALDRSGILPMHEDHKRDLNFPFATIADAMRFIDDVTLPVIVPKEEANPGEVEGWLSALPYAQGVGGLARKLGPYTVGVPRRARAAMVAAGAGVAEAVASDQLGNQFVVLRNLDLYSADFGLDWSDPAFRDVEGLIVG
jgi:CRISPR-associated endonuclease/helicase Cas3